MLGQIIEGRGPVAAIQIRGRCDVAVSPHKVYSYCSQSEISSAAIFAPLAMNSTEEAVGELIVSRGDGTINLEAPEHPRPAALQQ